MPMMVPEENPKLFYGRVLSSRGFLHLCQTTDGTSFDSIYIWHIQVICWDEGSLHLSVQLLPCKQGICFRAVRSSIVREYPWTGDVILEMTNCL